MSTSETPRTDSEAMDVWNDGCGNREDMRPSGQYVEASFARQLERELAAARADSERLDWLEKHTQFEFRYIGTGTYLDGQRNFAMGCVLRAVIDAGRAAIDSARQGGSQ